MRGWGSTVLIVLVGAALMTLILNVMFPDLRVVRSVVEALPGYSKPEPVEEPKPEVKPEAVKTPVARRRTPPKAAVTEPSNVEEPKAETISIALLPTPQNPDEAIVERDGVPIYSSNSSQSPVVGVLQKGAKVERNLEVIDRAGRWSLVRDEKQRTVGFVKSETLLIQARKETGTKSSPVTLQSP